MLLVIYVRHKVENRHRDGMNLSKIRATSIWENNTIFKSVFEYKLKFLDGR